MPLRVQISTRAVAAARIRWACRYGDAPERWRHHMDTDTYARPGTDYAEGRPLTHHEAIVAWELKADRVLTEYQTFTDYGMDAAARS